MKCEAYVLWVPARKKGSGQEYLKAKDIKGPWDIQDTNPIGGGFRKTLAELTSEGYTPCGGRILVDARAEDEPYMGGTSAILEVSTVCEKCGNTDHPWSYEDTRYLGKQFVSLRDHIARSLSHIVSEWVSEAQRPDEVHPSPSHGSVTPVPEKQDAAENTGPEMDGSSE